MTYMPRISSVKVIAGYSRLTGRLAVGPLIALYYCLDCKIHFEGMNGMAAVEIANAKYLLSLDLNSKQDTYDFEPLINKIRMSE